MPTKKYLEIDRVMHASPRPAAANRVKRILRLGVEIMLVVALILGIRACNAPELPHAQFPAMQLLSLQGNEVSIPATNARPMIVHIWAEWCPVCRLELDSIATLAQEVPLVSFAWKSGDDAHIERFLREQNISLDVINDPSGRILATLGIKAVPLHLVLDGDGTIRFVETGYTTAWGLKARLWWLEHFGS